MAKDGRKLRRSSRRCILAAAFRVRCFALSMQLATNWMTVESTAWIPDLEAPQQCHALAARGENPGWRAEGCQARTRRTSRQTPRYARRLALERPLLDGGVTPKRDRTGALSRSQSQTSLSPVAWESWAKSIDERWLRRLKLRAFDSTPVSRAWRLINPRGIRLSICLRTTTSARVGVVFFTHHLPSGRDFDSTSTRFYSLS